MLGGLKIFSGTTSLQISKEKSEVFLIGMNAEQKARIAALSGFRTGTLPFKYLGVPITSKKLKKKLDCDMPVEKMCNRIKI